MTVNMSAPNLNSGTNSILVRENCNDPISVSEFVSLLRHMHISKVPVSLYKNPSRLDFSTCKELKKKSEIRKLEKERVKKKRVQEEKEMGNLCRDGATKENKPQLEPPHVEIITTVCRS